MRHSIMKQTNYQTFSIMVHSDDGLSSESSYINNLDTYFHHLNDSQPDEDEEKLFYQNRSLFSNSETPDFDQNIPLNVSNIHMHNYQQKRNHSLFTNADLSPPFLKSNILHNIHLPQCFICSCLQCKCCSKRYSYNPTIHQLCLLTMLLQFMNVAIITLYSSENEILHMMNIGYILGIAFLWFLQLLIIVQCLILVFVHYDELQKQPLFSNEKRRKKNDGYDEERTLSLLETCFLFVSWVFMFAGLYLIINSWNRRSTFKSKSFDNGRLIYYEDELSAILKIFHLWTVFFYYSTSQQTLAGMSDVRPVFIISLIVGSIQFFVGVFFAILLIAFAFAQCRTLHEMKQRLAIERIHRMLNTYQKNTSPVLTARQSRKISLSSSTKLPSTPDHPQFDRLGKQSIGIMSGILLDTSVEELKELKEDIEEDQKDQELNTNFLLTDSPSSYLRKPVAYASIPDTISPPTIDELDHQPPIQPPKKTRNIIKTLWHKIKHYRKIRKYRRILRQYLLLVVCILVFSKLILYQILQTHDFSSTYVLIIGVVSNTILMFIILMVSIKFISPFNHLSKRYQYHYYLAKKSLIMNSMLPSSYDYYSAIPSTNYIPLITASFLAQLYISFIVIFVGAYLDIELYVQYAVSENETFNFEIQNPNISYFAMIFDLIYFSLANMTLGGSNSIQPRVWYALVLANIQMFVGFMFKIIVFGYGIMKLTHASSVYGAIAANKNALKNL